MDGLSPTFKTHSKQRPVSQLSCPYTHRQGLQAHIFPSIPTKLLRRVIVGCSVKRRRFWRRRDNFRSAATSASTKSDPPPWI
nr:hypothetical protein Itr_chr04CG02450 [Ipomoea trifida]